MKTSYLIIISILSALALGSCTNVEIEPVNVVRLDKLIQDFPLDTSSQQDSIILKYDSELTAMFRVLGWPSPSSNEIIWWSEGEVVKAFQPAVDSVFPNLNNVESQLGHIKLRNQQLHLEIPDNLQFVSVTWGKPQPIVRVDSIFLIALNHYLGKDFPGYSHWDYFRRQEKTPQQLPYDLAATIIATQYPFQMETPTLLSWMLYEGALMEARMTLLYEPKLNIALGYTSDQLEYLEDNTHGIWQDLILMKVLYSTDPDLIDRMIAPMPISPLINYKVPGRIGRYIGYKIVKEYLKKNTKATLLDLFQPSFYSNPQKVLIDSGFGS